MGDSVIKIIPATSGQGTAFQPDIPGFNPGEALPAQQNDVVSWKNLTDDTHQPWPTEPWPTDPNESVQPLSDADVLPRGSANYLSDPIPPGEPSTPAYVVQQPDTAPDEWIVYYYCRLHPDNEAERGTISATIPPNS